MTKLAHRWTSPCRPVSTQHQQAAFSLTSFSSWSFACTKSQQNLRGIMAFAFLLLWQTTARMMLRLRQDLVLRLLFFQLSLVLAAFLFQLPPKSLCTTESPAEHTTQAAAVSVSSSVSSLTDGTNPHERESLRRCHIFALCDTFLCLSSRLLRSLFLVHGSRWRRSFSF